MKAEIPQEWHIKMKRVNGKLYYIVPLDVFMTGEELAEVLKNNKQGVNFPWPQIERKKGWW